MAAPAVNLNSSIGDYPFANSQATRMLAEGLRQADHDHGWSQRDIAKMLHYKTSVVVSHMALGRVPIPVDRALDFARLLKLPAKGFLLAVLEQRYPEINWEHHLAGVGGKPAKRNESFVVSELEALAGMELDHLPQQVVNVLREVVAGAASAPRRWMALHEVPIIEKLRSHLPYGLTPGQRKTLEDFIDKM